MRKLSIAILIAMLAAALVISGCGGGGGGGDKGEDDATGDTIVTGIVKDNRSTPQPVAGVIVTLGSAGTQVTGEDGRFTFNLGTASVTSLFTYITDAYIKVSTKNAGEDYPEVSVLYKGTYYDQIWDDGGASIPLPTDVSVAQGGTKDLGTITVQYNNSENPPPVPW